MQGLVPSFAEAGVKALVLTARDEGKLRSIESEVHKINPNIETLVVPLDVSDDAAVKSLFSKIQAKFGRHADVLVNNAGVNVAVNGGGPVLHEASVHEWWSNFVSRPLFYSLSLYHSSLPSRTTKLLTTDGRRSTSKAIL